LTSKSVDIISLHIKPYKPKLEDWFAIWRITFKLQLLSQTIFLGLEKCWIEISARKQCWIEISFRQVQVSGCIIAQLVYPSRRCHRFTKDCFRRSSKTNRVQFSMLCTYFICYINDTQ